MGGAPRNPAPRLQESGLVRMVKLSGCHRTDAFGGGKKHIAECGPPLGALPLSPKRWEEKKNLAPHRLNGYLVLQGNIPLRTSQLKHVVKLLATERLGIHWAKYPFSRRRKMSRSASMVSQRKTQKTIDIHINMQQENNK